MEFLTQLRMNKAKELLLVSDQNVREVARSVGYRDECYFSRRFKEKNGCAPSIYSRQNHPNVVSLSAPYTDHLLTLGIIPCAAQEDKQIPPGTKALSLPRETLLLFGTGAVDSLWPRRYWQAAGYGSISAFEESPL